MRRASINQSVGRDVGPSGPPAAKKSSNVSEGKKPTGPDGPELLGGAAAAKVVQRKEIKLAAAQQTAERREASRGAEPLPDGMDFRLGDCRQVLADVADNSVALVLTDPPYGDEAEPLYRWLAEWSRRVLVPGGSLICFTGQSRLDRDLRIFSGNLRYWWTLALVHKQPQRFPGKFVLAGFKPVLWFVKDTRRGKTLVSDFLRDDGRDKQEHDWGQGDAGIGQLIEGLTSPSELIADPFAGSRLWGKMSAAMGRRWIGADAVDGGDTNIVADAAAE